MTDLISQLKKTVDTELRQLLQTMYGFSGTPSQDEPYLHPTIRYVLEGEGKRVRGVLCLLTAQAFGGSIPEAIPAALALEMVHTYSLVHDDLPCMDDDDYRRGRPTAHKVFGEPYALLAGDGLLTDAFFILSRSDETLPRGYPPETAVKLMGELAAAAGSHGMVLGQSLDLFWTAKSSPNLETVLEIHRLKTGYLMGAATAMGAILGGAAPERVEDMRSFGRLLGVTFQILDDLLDNQEGLGKTPGKDQASGKMTLLTSVSAAVAKDLAEEYTQKGLKLLKGATPNASALMEYSQMLLKRNF